MEFRLVVEFRGNNRLDVQLACTEFLIQLRKDGFEDLSAELVELEGSYGVLRP